jgi:hypothetical protein
MYPQIPKFPLAQIEHLFYNKSVNRYCGGVHMLRSEVNEEFLRLDTEVHSKLELAGIAPQRITRRQGTQFFVAEFYNPQMQDPVQPSYKWATLLEEHISGIRIIDTNDTIANWREGAPVIWASVTFTFK